MLVNLFLKDLNLLDLNNMHPYQDIKTITSPNQCFSWWLVHSYLYYRHNTSVISDKDFDTLTSWVKMSWDQITHWHKHLVTMEDLNAGSGFAVNFPLRVENSAMHVLREIESKTARQVPAKKANSRPSPKTKQKSNNTFNEYDTLFT